MDVMPQTYGSLLQSASLPLSVDTILRPVSLEHGGSFSGYFTEVDLPGLAGEPATVAFYLTSETISPIVGQYFDQDFLGNMVEVWNTFIDSGQVWALLFGIVLGYMIRNLTAF
jgi:hypothetical protein